MYLIFPLKTLTLTGKWAYEEYLQINLPIFFFVSSLSLLNLKISELITKELPQITLQKSSSVSSFVNQKLQVFEIGGERS